MTQPLSFDALTEDPERCRFPVEGGWCGAETAAPAPYCRRHAAIAYLPHELWEAVLSELTVECVAIVADETKKKEPTEAA